MKKFGIIFASIIATIYLAFLILPFIITPIANSYIPLVNEEIKKATGLNSKIEGFRQTTVEEFRDNVLKTFAFNIRAQNFTDTFSKQDSFNTITMQTTQRIAHEDYFQRQFNPKTYTQLDERVDSFSRYQQG